LQIRIGVIPLGGDILEGQTEGFALAGREWREIKVHGFIVGSASLENTNGQFLALRRLSHIVFERDLRDRVNDGLVSGIGDRAIDVAENFREAA
jgi:hypothetical protein